MKKVLFFLFLFVVAALVGVHLIAHEPPANPSTPTPQPVIAPTPVPCDLVQPPRRAWPRHCANPACVVWEHVNEPRRWVEPEWDGACLCAYNAFLDHAEVAAHIQSISAADLADQVTAAETRTGDVPAKDPAMQIRNVLRTDFLLKRTRPLHATVVAREKRDPGMLWKILVHDPLVGVFRLALWVPNQATADTPVPVVISLHGHGENVERALGARQANRFVAAGFAFASPNFRCINGDPLTVESEATARLLRAGFSFVAVRLYELTLTQRLLEDLAIIDSKRLGLLGHSSGSMLLNVVSHAYDLGVRAGVTDRTGRYLERTPDGDYIDTLTPGLTPFSTFLADADRARFPVLMQPYGYPAGPDAAISFFAQHLR